MHRYDFLGIALVQHVAKYQIIHTTPSKIPLRVKMIQDYYSFNQLKYNYLRIFAIFSILLGKINF